jgi:oxygen-dependent protoporphyrinogen oxidase
MMFDVQPSSASARQTDTDVIVVGAGIAGLVAAHDLASHGLSTIVIERGDHVGGRIQTERKPGVYLEHGGIFHTHGYTAMRRLLDELGLADEVIATEGGFYSAVRHEGGWEHVDYGSLTARFASAPARSAAWPPRADTSRPVASTWPVTT